MHPPPPLLRIAGCAAAILACAAPLDAQGGAVSAPAPFSRHLGDFNGDGRADVLLRHADGRWQYYAMNGRLRIDEQSGSVQLPADLAYRVAGIGDFDGDGRDDVLLRHADGGWSRYAMNGRHATPMGAKMPGGLDGSAQIGIGDFDGDGRDDVLLRRADGGWTYHAMRGDGASAGANVADLPRSANYRLAGIGDFNGDGFDDALLRHADGSWHYHPLQGARVLPGGGAANLTRNAEYRVAGIGDFDGDGSDDVLLRHADGRWHYYAVRGRRAAPGQHGPANLTANTRYRLAGIGDLDGDGCADVLLRHADGRWYYYAMHGRHFIRGRQGPANLTRASRWTVATPRVAPSAGAGVIAGALAVPPGLVLDGDTSDARDPVVGNDALESPQDVPLPVSVAGFADSDRDAIDVYRVAFPDAPDSPALVRISLAIADADQADLDLHLLDAQGAVIAESLGVDAVEMIAAARAGEHLIVVSAYEGASNYELVAAVDATARGVAHGAAWSRDGEFVPGELIVMSRAGASVLDAALADAPPVPGDAGAGLPMLRFDARSGAAREAVRHAERGFAAERATPELRQRAATLTLLKSLRRGRAAGEPEYAQPNYIYRAAAVPNDAYFGYQWHYPRISLPQAWDITTGDDSIVTAVIDTGIAASHPDLQPRLLREADGRLAGYDFISDPALSGDGDGIDPDPRDAGGNFHGTHVAGIIGAATNNGIGVAGVTWRGSILPVRVLGAAGGTSWDIAQGIRYAAGLPNDSGIVPASPARIINLSIGRANSGCLPQPTDAATRAALEDAQSAGAIIVAAAGNDDCREPTPIAAADGVISVGAVDDSGRWSRSNYGPALDVVAPGGSAAADLNGDGNPDGILSTAARATPVGAGATYVRAQGTSMAAPHVAGVVGLMLAVNPYLASQDINRLLAGTHPDSAAGPIATDWGDPGRDDLFGHGLIDARRAVEVARAIHGGGAQTQRGPVLAAAPARIDLGLAASALRLQLRNSGGGVLGIESVAVDASWLSASYESDSTEAEPVLVVRADRTGLAAGSYAARIAIVSNGGDAAIAATLQVAPPASRNGGGGDIGTIHILALDAGSGEIRARSETSARRRYAFQLPPLPGGSYRILAGTDRDGDGRICDAGEACGAWPLPDGTAAIEVDGDRRADFGVSMDLYARLASQGFAGETATMRGVPIRR